MKAADFLAVAHAFRLGHVSEGNEALTKVVDGIKKAMPSLAPDFRLRLLRPLSSLLAAQERGDYAVLADVLQYELVPLLF